MPLEEPAWWYDRRAHPRLIAPLLTLLARAYGSIAQARYRRRTPYRSRLPVICAGNFTAGGTGKTPLSLFIADLLLARNAKPAFLTRGYGGREPGPVWVTDCADAADRFGDEPLLLARMAPTLVAHDRALGAQAIEDSDLGFTAIIMDDGLQNPALAKDLSIAVVDGARGLGNGEVIPAGPLRAPMEFQLGLVDAIVVREPDAAPDAEQGIHELLRRRFPGPVLAARTEPQGDVSWLKDAPVIAFAGIANPDRFFTLLERLGARIVARVSYPDHHAFTREEVDGLLALATEKAAALVTTEKDWVRLADRDGAGAALRSHARTLPIALAFDGRDLKRLHSLIDATLQRDRTASA